MTFLRRFLLSRAARQLGRRSHASQRERILARARQMRRQLGLPPDHRLAS